MTTAESLELLREERDLLELLCQTRLRQVEEIEGERDMYMEGERRVEALNEDLDEKLSKLVVEQCGNPIKPMSFDSMLREITEQLTNQRRLLDQTEPVCNRLTAFVYGELEQTPEDFEHALDLVLAQVRLLRPKETP
jgi:DNA repair exonuclease SbcCD ATPase subunit